MTWHYSNYFSAINRVIAVGNEVRSTGTWIVSIRIGATITTTRTIYSWAIVREGDSWNIRRDTMSGTAANPAGVVH